MMHAGGGAFFSSSCIDLHVEDGHFESCLKTIGASGQILWTIAISFWGGFEPSHGLILHCAVRRYISEN